MRRPGRPRVVELPPLTGEQQRRLDAWVAHLDVDLDAAQAVLALPPGQWPPPPGEAPPAPVPARRGAYARRAARATG